MPLELGSRASRDPEGPCSPGGGPGCVETQGEKNSCHRTRRALTGTWGRAEAGELERERQLSVLMAGGPRGTDAGRRRGGRTSTAV